MGAICVRLSWLHRARRRMVVKKERAEIVFTVSFQTPPLISFAQVFVKSDRLLLVIHVRRILLVYPSWSMISGGGFSRSKAEREKGSVVRQVLWRKSSFSISCRFERQSFFFLSKSSMTHPTCWTRQTSTLDTYYHRWLSFRAPPPVAARKK